MLSDSDMCGKQDDRQVLTIRSL